MGGVGVGSVDFQRRKHQIIRIAVKHVKEIKMIKKQDSKHEKYFDWWADEAIKKGLIKDVIEGPVIQITPSQTIPFEKIDKKGNVKLVDKSLFQSYTYKPDRIIKWNRDNSLHDDMWSLSSKSNAFFWSHMNGGSNIGISGPVTILDIKPDKVNGKHQATSRTFPINQKLMWELYDMYVQKVVLYPASNSDFKKKMLFTQTWTPKLMITDEDWLYKRDSKWGKKGESKIKWKVKTIDELF